MDHTDLLDSAAAAQRLGVAASTLAAWRMQRTGPRYVRVGGSKNGPVRYRPADLDAYLAAHVVEPAQP